MNFWIVVPRTSAETCSWQVFHCCSHSLLQLNHIAHRMLYFFLKHFQFSNHVSPLLEVIITWSFSGVCQDIYCLYICLVFMWGLLSYDSNGDLYALHSLHLQPDTSTSMQQSTAQMKGMAQLHHFHHIYQAAYFPV